MNFNVTYEHEQPSNDDSQQAFLDEQSQLDFHDLEKLADLIYELMKKEIRLCNEREGRSL
jgi:hypothetical protein